MTIESTRFGTLEIQTEAVVEFPEGLIGLGGRRFALLAAGADTPFAWLHSLDDPDLALPVTDPFPFFPDYQVELSDEAAEHIGVRLEDKPEVLVTVRAGDQAKSVCANLRAPIIVAGGLAHQAINEASGAPLRAPLAA